MVRRGGAADVVRRGGAADVVCRGGVAYVVRRGGAADVVCRGGVAEVGTVVVKDGLEDKLPAHFIVRLNNASEQGEKLRYSSSVSTKRPLLGENNAILPSKAA